MSALVDFLDLHLVDGRLPRARSNEIAISQALAQSRGLGVGFTVGGLSMGEGEGEADPLIVDDIPTEMVVVGLLSRDDLWLGLASLEYLESHELTASRPTHLLLVPAKGRKDELDTWLKGNVASGQTSIVTYEDQKRAFQEGARALNLLLIGVEASIVVVMTAALVTLNIVFWVQRREEFGVLHAVGWGRLCLVLRTSKETASVVGIAWLLGAAVCLIGLLLMQALVYAPRGLNVEVLSGSPWLFTLPIPLAVVAASTGTIARELRLLDPVAVIERR
jgi:hypothetical protein